MDECNNIIDRHLKKDKKERKPRKKTEKELFENNKKIILNQLITNLKRKLKRNNYLSFLSFLSFLDY